MTCALNNNKFAVSVADALLFDESCGGEQLILSAKTLINSSITQAIQETDVYGGKGSQLEYTFNYQKLINVTLEDSVFSPVYLAIQNGTNISEELGKFYKTEDVTFDENGVATLKGTPVGNVQVAQEGGTFSTVVPSVQTITSLANAGKSTTATYAEEGTYETIVIDANTFPKALKLVLTIDIFDANGKVQEMQITIPKFKPDGAMELSLTHDGVATSTLAGKALSDCGRYADIKFLNVANTGDKACYSALVASPNDVEIDSTEVGSEVVISVLGVRGGIYGNVTIANDKLTWVSDDPDKVEVTNGVIKLGATGALGDTATVTVSDPNTPTLFDEITVTVV